MAAEIERALLAALRRGPSGASAEPYLLPETAIPALERTLTKVLAATNALEELKRALALSTGLRNLGAVAASNRIEALLRADPSATALIAEQLLPAQNTSTAAKNAEPLRAPMIDAPKPSGPRVADFLNPGRTDRIRR